MNHSLSPISSFETDHNLIYDDPSISLVVIAVNDADIALNIAVKSLKQARTVVTSNKVFLAKHLKFLLDIEAEYGGKLLYEASVAAAIPIFSMLKNYLFAEDIERVQGILNGTSNFILSKILF